MFLAQAKYQYNVYRKPNQIKASNVYSLFNVFVVMYSLSLYSK